MTKIDINISVNELIYSNKIEFKCPKCGNIGDFYYRRTSGCTIRLSSPIYEFTETEIECKCGFIIYRECES